MSKYLKQLQADLPHWVQAGYVSADGSAAMLREVEGRAGQSWFRLPLMLSMLGGILIFAGVISFVAAGWDDIPRLMKVTLLLASMAGCFVAAHALRGRGSDGLGHGLAFLGTLFFGANIMLIAQIYNLPPNPPAGALMWALGASLVALLWPSQLVAALALLLTGIWTWFAGAEGNRDILFSFFDNGRDQLHLQFLLLWAPLAVVAIKQHWGKAVHVAGLMLAFWLYHLTLGIFDNHAMSYAGFVLIAFIAAFTLAGRKLEIARAGSNTLSKYVWVLFALWLMLASWDETRSYAYTYRIHELDDGTVILPFFLWLGVPAVLGMIGVCRNILRPAAAGLVMAASLPMITVLANWEGSSASINGAYLMISLLVLAFALGAIIEGYRQSNSFYINLGFTLFTFKVIWIYFETVWGLQAQAVFFTLGGILVMVLGIVTDRQRRKLLNQIQLRS